ncbi:MAG: hypothetical protein HC836_10585 [Richelia sp. RM2_1_2]|nr:hypothetical protein [Richelia sp. RM2_1_2]
MKILYSDNFPQACINNCAASGDVGPSVVKWRKMLNFTVDRDEATACLAGYGAWEAIEIATMTDEQVAETILWLACCDFKEGSDLFVIE